MGAPTRAGAASISNVTLTDVLDSRLDFDSSVPSGTWNAGTHTFSLTLASLAAGAAGRVTITAQFNATASVGNSVPNTAGIAASGYPGASSNGCTVTVAGPRTTATFTSYAQPHAHRDDDGHAERHAHSVAQQRLAAPPPLDTSSASPTFTHDPAADGKLHAQPHNHADAQRQPQRVANAQQHADRHAQRHRGDTLGHQHPYAVGFLHGDGHRQRHYHGGPQPQQRRPAPRLPPAPSATASVTLVDSPSATATSTPLSSATATVTVTSSSTAVVASATATWTVTTTPTSSNTPAFAPAPTAAPSNTTVTDGPNEIDQKAAYPDPWSGTGPGYVLAKLEGRVDQVTVKFYTNAMVCVGQAQGGPSPAGWARVALPPELRTLPSGTYYYCIKSERAGQVNLKPAIGALVILR